MNQRSSRRWPSIRSIGLVIGLAGAMTWLAFFPSLVRASTSVSGVVYDQGTTPIAGAQVCVHGPIGECVTTDNAGAFSFASHPLPAGHYNGQAVPAASDTTHGQSTWTEFDVVDGVPANLTFHLPTATKTITGVVTRTGGGVVGGACVNANKMNGQGWSGAQTNSAGTYALQLSGGTWNVQINPCQPDADWVFAGVPIMIDFAIDETIESKSANFSVVSANSSVSGVVTDQNGAPITTGSVSFRRQDGAQANANPSTGGAYSVRMAGGIYEVYFWTQNNGYNLPQTTVTVGDGEHKTLNLVVQAKTAHIKGTVRDGDGVPVEGVMVNAGEMTGAAGKPSAWGNARSDASGKFDLLVTPATYNVNIGTEPDSQYIWANPTNIQVAVPTASSVVTTSDYPALNFVVQKADATITGTVTAGGQNISNNSMCVWARRVGVTNQMCSPIQPNGSYTIRVSSAGGTAFEIGCFSPPNMPYSCPQPVSVTIVPHGTVVKPLDLTINNSSIIGQLYDQSGFPLSNCESFRGGRVFADNPGGTGAHYEGEIGTDCRYKISLVAGVYFMNSFFPPESGAMNAPPGTPVQVFSGQSVQKNIMVAKSDAYITVTLLDQNGNGTQGYINVDNNEEINMAREGNQGAGGNGAANLGFGKKMPCGASDIAGVMKCCKESKNKQSCKAFAIPDGPQGCKNAWDCVQLCKKNKSICDQAIQNNRNSGPQPGQGGFSAGPGGCKSETECKAYCSQPIHQNECANFKPPAAAQSQSVRISSVVKATAAEPAAKDNASNAGADKGIHSSGPTDMRGNAKILVLSGHRYKVCAGLPPESDAMPPKCQDADLTKVKSALVTLQLRAADAQVKGVVKMPNGSPASRCYVHAWSDDGGFSGQPCASDGSYRVNLTADTKWHIGADSMDGTKFYRSDEFVLVVNKGTKLYTKNLSLIEGRFEVPQPVTTSGACSSPLVLSMTNGAKISIPAGGLSTSASGTCSCAASPTIDLISTQSNQPVGSGYTIDCRDETGAQVTTLKASATITVPYTLSASEEGTSIEDALKPVLYQSDTRSYKTVDSYTLDKTNDLITFSVDHFSAYTISNASGTSAKTALKAVTTGKSKAGVPYFKISGKTVYPYPKCKGNMSVTTNSVNGAQLIAVGSSCDGNLKVYTTAGKLKKQVSTKWRGVSGLSFADVTKDGAADIIASPMSGRETWVIDVYKKYAIYKAAASKRIGRITANAIDFRGTGIDSLVTGVVTNGKAGSFQVYNYSRGKFAATASSYSSFLQNSGGSIVLSIPAPSVKAVKGTVKVSQTKAKVTVTGKNFTPGIAVLINSVGTKVTYKSTTQIVVTFNAAKVGKGKFALKLINQGGRAVTASATKLKVNVK